MKRMQLFTASVHKVFCLDRNSSCISLLNRVSCTEATSTSYRFPGAANQMFQRFFKKVATVNYSRASSFIVELLQVGVNGLLSVHADHVTQDREAVQKFDRDLQDFIAKNLSKGRLLLLTKEMLVSLIF